MPVTNPILKRLNNHIKKNFGVLLRAELKSRGIKYSFVAEKIGVERSYFHRVLQGQDFLSAEAIETIADILGIEADSLLAQVYYSKNLGDYLESEDN
jgi:transcriptional regulator with XRE-family HTH domain